MYLRYPLPTPLSPALQFTVEIGTARCIHTAANKSTGFGSQWSTLSAAADCVPIYIVQCIIESAKKNTLSYLQSPSAGLVLYCIFSYHCGYIKRGEGGIFASHCLQYQGAFIK